MYSYNQDSASWGKPAFPDAAQGQYRQRSSTSPTSGTRPTPRTMMPGYPSTIHSPDLYFGAPTAPAMYPSHTVPHLPPHPIPQHSNSAPPIPEKGPYLYRANTAPPPVPPKLTMSIPELPPKMPVPTFFEPAEVPIEPNVPTYDEASADQEALSKALALSEEESKKRAEFLEKLTSQEEEDLARALEESMKFSEPAYNSFTSTPVAGSPHVYNNPAGTSKAAFSWDAAAAQSSSSEPSSSDVMQAHQSDSWQDRVPDSNAGDDDDDEDVRLAYDEDEPEAGETRTPGPSSAPHSTRSNSILDDEALARRIAEEEAHLNPPLSSPKSLNTPYSPPTSLPSIVEDEALARSLAEEEERTHSFHQASGASLPLKGGMHDVDQPVQAPAPPPYVPRQDHANGAHTAGNQKAQIDYDLLRSESDASTSNGVTLSSSPGNSPLPDSASSATSEFSATTSNSSVSLPTDATEPSLQEIAMLPAINYNNYVDKDLLRGVSIGFGQPVVSQQLLPMDAVMPNIISLPYGKCPPLHLQAPNWRHLLKLMAWLSGTRIEPTVEALAVTKSNELLLRTVIQFVRPHTTSNDWRTILWFTIDHPVPRSVPGARKYTNNDVEVLPWSYTLSTIPTLLKDANDTSVSKTYTIPTTEAVPYPPLPISFPNLALYLQAALEESRRHLNDSSSGNRKLAKMMEICYPSVFEEDTPHHAERGRVGGLLKKVIGRRKRQGRGGGNEDTYELVTPFMPDQWG